MNEKSASENKAPFYYSLSSVCDNFDFKAREILGLAISGDIVLSVKIPDGCSPYLMSVADTETHKAFGFLTNTKKALENISMLPKAVSSSYLNLRVEDCETLKTSNIKQSIFESAFIDGVSSDLQHEMVNQSSDFLYEVKLGGIIVNILKYKKNEIPKLKNEVTNNFSLKSKDRLNNGFYAVWSGKYLRKFVLIDDESEVNDVGDSEYLASSKLNQSMIKAISITQHDIVISSNYKKVFEKPENIPTPTKSSPYYVKPELREFSGLFALAGIGYQYFIIDKEKAVEPLKLLINKQNSFDKKTLDAVVFFLNLSPHHNANLHRDTKEEGCRCQFKYLLKESEKYWFDINLDDQSESDIDDLRATFATLLHGVGFSNEKAIDGEFLALPNKLKKVKGVKRLNIVNIFGC